MELNFTRSEGFVDARILSQFEAEKLKWREVLTRILHCIKFLATQNLALRGHREPHHMLDNSNVGNFLGLLKLVSTYIFDPVMKEHLRNAESHPGSTSYLSPCIQNEFLHLLASAVRWRLLKSIHVAKYYGLMFDSTPDIAHRDQMSEVVRFVDIDFEKKTVQVKETFLGFIEITVKNAKGLANCILEQLKKDEMDFQDCRSQCYDNAAVMAGHKNGVNEKLTEINRRALFVNCDNHSLNLVGVHVAKQNVTMVTFFGTIESLYAFFSRSTSRWEKLKEAIPVVIKSKSESRWSANVEAIKPVNNYLEKILGVLEEMTEDKNQTSETRSDVQQLFNRMLKYDFLILLGFWNKVLIRIDRVQKRLQDPTMNFHDAAEDLKALQNYFENEREAITDSSLEEGIILCEKWDVATERRRR
ncbi:unnamed protein product [Acanthoscelides obtectus]|uniref:DUF4371 domain-containing protein n=1 Tax=Acanthoscelides obtectus TaxID=200917 RepID=A0A9P0P6M7_ACAOB|nr:unnamed protein product [Acanthoscelides obtectus]CAK1647624.1 Zinc finger MYM-type protein 1 [Acanthoscelides obtectus]